MSANKKELIQGLREERATLLARVEAIDNALVGFGTAPVEARRTRTPQAKTPERRKALLDYVNEHCEDWTPFHQVVTATGERSTACTILGDLALAQMVEERRTGDRRFVRRLDRTREALSQ